MKINEPLKASNKEISLPPSLHPARDALLEQLLQKSFGFGACPVCDDPLPCSRQDTVEAEQARLGGFQYSQVDLKSRFCIGLG